MNAQNFVILLANTYNLRSKRQVVRGLDYQKLMLPFEGSVEGEGSKKEGSIRQASLSSANLPQKLLGVPGLANGSGRQVDEVVTIPVDCIEEFNL